MKRPCFSLLSISIILLLLLVALAAWTANARKDSGDYWKGVMKDESMPAALEALILPIPHTSSSQSTSLVKKPDCRHEDPTASHAEGKTFGYDIEPRPSATAYADGELGSMEATILSKNFEPRDSVTSSYQHQGSGYVLVVEPNSSSYKGDKTDVNIPVAESFEPRPNVSAYGD